MADQQLGKKTLKKYIFVLFYHDRNKKFKIYGTPFLGGRGRAGVDN